jgi:phosphoribosylformimino-5-aminoimidazole carboxamide ribotide isomerase
MHILPVLDLIGGRVVRGVGGRREEYRPVESQLVSSSEPQAVARAFADRFGLTDLYLADLDAIAGAAPAWDVYRALCDAGFRLWVDAGVRELGRTLDLAAGWIDGVVLGLETLAGPEVLARSVERLGGKVVFSLDLRGGQPLGDRAAWRDGDAYSTAAEAVRAGVRRMIVLDLARVGGGAGLGTESLCARLAAEHSAVEVYAGGGVGGLDDLRRLRDSGVRGALVASALHDGRLRPEDLAAQNTSRQMEK